MYFNNSHVKLAQPSRGHKKMPLEYRGYDRMNKFHGWFHDLGKSYLKNLLRNETSFSIIFNPESKTISVS